MVIWFSNPRYDSVFVATIYALMLTGFSPAFYVDRKLSIAEILSTLCIFLGILIICCVSVIPYREWYEDNYFTIVRGNDVTSVTYVIPQETENVRFPYGLDYYQIAAYKEMIDGDYKVKFFRYYENEHFGSGKYRQSYEKYNFY